ncbi:MAG: DoxX family protein [Lysobacterales bacterium]|nr:DoxX family protein [Xanthomonadales bacterium]MCP5477006.1 DoxX family protein [Rhodanobacteraceae bacterium]
MFEKIIQWADLPARVAMSAIFILSGLGKLSAFDLTRGYMEAYGVPAALLVPTIAFELGAGAALLVGFGTRYAALLLSGFCLVAAMVFHRDFGDQIQQIMFLKNVAMAGGLLLLAKTGAPELSLERMLSKTRGMH